MTALSSSSEPTKTRVHHYMPDVFNDVAARTPPVPYKLSPEEIERRKDLYADYYNQQIANIREYYKLKGYETADAFLDVLLELKKGTLRKDGYTPDYGHEIDLIISCISDIESGQMDIEATEKKYGSLESLLISATCHDLAEDFGLMPQDLYNRVRNKLNHKIGASIRDPKYNKLIYRGMQSMERLTHDRHYSIDAFVEQFAEEFYSQFGYELNIPQPQRGQLIDLSDDVKEFLQLLS